MKIPSPGYRPHAVGVSQDRSFPATSSMSCRLSIRLKETLDLLPLAPFPPAGFDYINIFGTNHILRYQAYYQRLSLALEDNGAVATPDRLAPFPRWRRLGSCEANYIFQYPLPSKVTIEVIDNTPRLSLFGSGPVRDRIAAIFPLALVELFTKAFLDSEPSYSIHFREAAARWPRGPRDRACSVRKQRTDTLRCTDRANRSQHRGVWIHRTDLGG